MAAHPLPCARFRRASWVHQLAQLMLEHDVAAPDALTVPLPPPPPQERTAEENLRKERKWMHTLVSNTAPSCRPEHHSSREAPSLTSIIGIEPQPTENILSWELTSNCIHMHRARKIGDSHVHQCGCNPAPMLMTKSGFWCEFPGDRR